MTIPGLNICDPFPNFRLKVKQAEVRVKRRLNRRTKRDEAKLKRRKTECSSQVMVNIHLAWKWIFFNCHHFLFSWHKKAQGTSRKDRTRETLQMPRMFSNVSTCFGLVQSRFSKALQTAGKILKFHSKNYYISFLEDNNLNDYWVGVVMEYFPFSFQINIANVSVRTPNVAICATFHKPGVLSCNT